MSSESPSTWSTALYSNRSSYLSELIELLRIPSVSTSEEHIGDVKQAAEWVGNRLAQAGAENVRLLPTGVHTAVYGEWLHAEGKPTILIYGHFDVQPADPLELWDSGPFEPKVEDGRVYARGANDMKGNLLITIHAFEALLRTSGRLPVNVKFLFEGQEEIGSRDLGPLVEQNRELLSCDLILTPDSLQWAEDQPVMWMGTKGLAGLQVDLTTASMDLHSGLYGGAVPNANHAMAELLVTLHDREGNILVDGFYNDVIPLTEAERTRFGAIPFDAKNYSAPMGVTDLVGESGYSTYERVWARPTLEINGMWGGFTGEGVKTVIPAEAHAKITCRLVMNQDPVQVLALLERHLQSHVPKGATIQIKRLPAIARAYQVPLDQPGAVVVAQVLEDAYGVAPYFVRIGGSLPITDMFLQQLGAHTIPVGFGLDDERMHSPNEFMRLESYWRGHEIYCQLLEALGNTSGSNLKQS